MKFSEYIKEEKDVRNLMITVKGIKYHIDRDKWINKRWTGDFNISNKGLTSLYGCPKMIDIGNFDCTGNKLKTLEGGPEEVNGLYDCNNNQLTSLKGGPKKVKMFTCENNALMSLEGGPETCNGDFYCDDNYILTSLEGAPKTVYGHFYCASCNISSLKDVHKIFKEISGEFNCVGNPIKSHVLGLLLIPNIRMIVARTEWSKIMNKYIGSGRKGMIDCQNELIEAGLEEFAQI